MLKGAMADMAVPLFVVRSSSHWLVLMAVTVDAEET